MKIIDFIETDVKLGVMCNKTTEHIGSGMLLVDWKNYGGIYNKTF